MSLSRFVFSRCWTLATLACAALLCVSTPARAFERQWHFGGGLGFATPSDGYSTGAALGVHGAYGLSDVFDVRLELQSSLHELVVEDPETGEEVSISTWFYGARAALAYKLDVIQWIPYGGVSAGGFAIAWNDGSLVRPSVGALVGLDYAASRHVGLGVVGTGDYVFVDSGVTMLAVLARAEYRFGW